jgi:hypothetical protein
MKYRKGLLLCIFSFIVIALFSGAVFATVVTDTKPSNNALTNTPPAFLEAEFDEDVSFVSMTLDGINVLAESHGGYILSSQSLGELALGIHNASVIAEDVNGKQIEAVWSFKLLPADAFVTSATLFANDTSVQVKSEEANATINIGVSSNTRIFMAPVSEPAANSDLRSIGKFVEITASDISAVSFPVALKVFYTDAEATAAGVDKSTLKIYFFNETGKSWHLEPTSTADALNNFVSASLSHLSVYGVFGSAQQSQPQPSGGGGGGSGGAAPVTSTGTSNNTTGAAGGSAAPSGTAETGGAQETAEGAAPQAGQETSGNAAGGFDALLIAAALGAIAVIAIAVIAVKMRKPKVSTAKRNHEES